MGTTGALKVEVAYSYARRSGDDVLLHVHLPAVEQLAQPVLRLRRIGKRRGKAVDAEASVSTATPGVMLSAAVPASAVTPGLWQLRLRDGDDDAFRRVRARLLVKPKQPIALLAGRAPDTLMAPPRPRQQPGNAQAGAGGIRGRLRRVARRLKPAR